MTRHDLEQIYFLNREMKLWQAELERVKCRSIVQSPVMGAIHSSNISDKVALQAERTIELEDKIRDKQEEIQRLRDEAVKFIYDIPDSLTRQIIYYHYVSLMSWRRVAYEIGGKNTEESVKKVCYRFFAKQQSCPECPD